jgi:hypothetical protein
MKKFPVMVFLFVALAFVGVAEAATPKRPPKTNQNRIGPYAIAAAGQTQFTSDQSVTESVMLNILQLGHPSQNLSVSTDDTDIGYHAQFGYRFHKYFAAELGMLKLGDLVTTARGDVDYPDRPAGFEPSTSEATFSSGGVLMSVIGVLPIGTRIELFGRIGYMFTSVERDFVSKANGERVLFGGLREDTQETVYGLGVGYNLTQVYAIHLEYQLIEELGKGAAGSEDVNFLSLGLQVRF